MLIPFCVVVLLAAAPVKLVSRADIARQLGKGVTEIDYDGHGRVKLVRGALATANGDVLQFLRDRAAPLGLRADEALAITRDERDPQGARHLRVSRSINKVPVAFDQIRVHASAQGVIYALESETSPLGEFSYGPPSLHPRRALQLATGSYQGRFEQPPETDLMIVGERLEGVSGAHLAYRVRVAFPPRPGEVPVIEEVYIDAHSGKQLGRLSLVFTDGTPITLSDTDLDGRAVTLNAAQYNDGIALQDLMTLKASGGQLLTFSGIARAIYTTKSAGAGFGDAAAVNVADYVRRAVQFDLDTFGWNRWDYNAAPSAAGGTLVGITHEGDHLANAYFTTVTANGRVIGTAHFGDGDGQTIVGLARCLDIVGHEVGHGIVAGTAGLVYHNQSGALNEHFADVFGWMLDSGNDTIGEGCTGAQLNFVPMRDMCHPAKSARAQPENMADYQTSPDTAEGDHGGVHGNSGIPNRAACLMRNATNFNTLGKIWFRALTQHLGQTSVFADMVQATATACTELAMGSAVCGKLNDAWVQVGLATPTAPTGNTCPPNSSPHGASCACNVGYHVNTAGTGCDADPAATCPLHAHAVGTDCYCDTGYAPNAAANACVPANSGAACGDHGHVEAGACVCDECYQYNASRNGEGQVCTPVPGCAICTDPLKKSSGGACVCEPGTQAGGNGSCQPIQGNCGQENYAGRCVGNTLVYCHDSDGPGHPLPPAQVIIQEIDCSKNTNRTICGISPVDGTFDCVLPRTNCGSVPATGTCAGNTAQLCDNGVLKSFDCGANGCSSYVFEGIPVNFCNLCPPNATFQDHHDGGGACTCNAGYVVDSTGTRCVAASGGSDGGINTDGGIGLAPKPSGGGGCSSAGGSLFVLLAALAFGLWARRSARP
jgi:bacillolysin